MSTIHPLPDDKQVHEMLGMLYGDDLRVSGGDPVATEANSKTLVAVYVSDDGAPVTACVCDFEFAAFAGAALSMIPAGGAKDAVKTGELTEMMLGNLNEVMNICSRLFISDQTPHLKLESVYAKVADLPDAARAMLDASAGRSDHKVSIPGYGEGCLSFLSC